MYLVGTVLKPQGLKGEVKVGVITSFPEHFKKLKVLYIKTKVDFEAYQVQQARVSAKFVFLKLDGISSIEDAEKLRSKEIYIKQDQLAVLKEGEYYIHDLVGIRVFDEQDNLIGQIEDVELAASNDNYVLLTQDGKSHLIPAIREIVKQVDIKNKRMTIHVMEGLLD